MRTSTFYPTRISETDVFGQPRWAVAICDGEKADPDDQVAMIMTVGDQSRWLAIRTAKLLNKSFTR